jgi:hypothetical protein
VDKQMLIRSPGKIREKITMIFLAREQQVDERDTNMR